jgi:hypothetical protein
VQDGDLHGACLCDGLCHQPWILPCHLSAMTEYCA